MKILNVIFAFLFISNVSFAADRVIINPESGGDLKIKINKGGTATDALVVSGATGTFNSTINDNTTLQWALRNTSTGTSAVAQFAVQPDGSTLGMKIGVAGSANSSTTLHSASRPYLSTSSGNGLVISVDNANGPIKFATGGIATTNERGSISNTGIWTIGKSGETNPHTINGPATMSGTGGNVVHACTRRNSALANVQDQLVDCLAGERVMGGGCNNTSDTATNYSYPSDDDTWTCRFAAVATNARAFAVCCQY